MMDDKTFKIVKAVIGGLILALLITWSVLYFMDKYKGKTYLSEVVWGGIVFSIIGLMMIKYGINIYQNFSK